MKLISYAKKFFHVATVASAYLAVVPTAVLPPKVAAGVTLASAIVSGALHWVTYFWPTVATP